MPITYTGKHAAAQEAARTVWIGVRDARRALHWRLRFRIARTAHGWIIEDFAHDGEVSAAVGRKITFHRTLESANAALLRARMRARKGYLPVPIEKLMAIRAQFEERLRMLQHELQLQLNDRPRSRHAKIIRKRIDQHTRMLAGICNQIEKLSRKGGAP